VPTPRVLDSVAELSQLVVHAPSVIVDLTPGGVTRSSEYHGLWPQALIYAYLQVSAIDPPCRALPLPLRDRPDWGARTYASRGVLAQCSFDGSPASTLDRFAQEQGMRQVSLLMLPASLDALSSLLGASELLGSASILTVVVLDETKPERAPAILADVAGILGKFGYRWASIDGAAVSIAIHERAEGILLSRKMIRARLPWLQAAQGLDIALKGIIHVGDNEARELRLYRDQQPLATLIIGPNARLHQRLIGRAASTSNVIYVDAPIGEPSELDQLATRYDFRQCNLLHIELDAFGLSGISGAADTLRHIDIVSVEFKRAAADTAGTDVSELDGCLRRHGFIRLSISTSIYPLRDAAVYVRKETLWARDPLKAAGIALQHADCSIGRVGFIGSKAHDLLRGSVSFAGNQQFFDVSVPRLVRKPQRVQVARPSPPLTVQIPGKVKVEVTYILQQLDKEHDRQAEQAFDAAPPDIDLLVLSHDSIEIFRGILQDITSSMRLSAIVLLGILGDEDMAAAISSAFDQGFLLDRSSAASTGRIFIRSELIREPGRWLGENNDYGQRHFRFSFLGELGRFGNQLFQLWHLILSGLRHDAAISSGHWELQQYFDLEFIEREGRGDILSVEPHEWRVMGLWALESLPDGIDFFGHFQWIPPFLHRHRVFLSRVFELRPEWASEMSKVILSLRSSGRPLSVFHVRRKDYVDHEMAFFRQIPVAWYKAALHELRDTTLYAASDDLEFVRREFPELPILSAEDFSGIPLPPAIIDHCVMRAADTLLVVNSTFSRSAAMMAKEGQAALLPSLQLTSFQPYAPWADPTFWFRFQSDDPAEYPKRAAEVQDWLKSAGLND